MSGELQRLLSLVRRSRDAEWRSVREDETASDRNADWIQETAIARANEIGLTADAIAERTDGAVREDHIHDYLTRRKSMGSHKLQHVLRALGLIVVPEETDEP